MGLGDGKIRGAAGAGTRRSTVEDKLDALREAILGAERHKAVVAASPHPVAHPEFEKLERGSQVAASLWAGLDTSLRNRDIDMTEAQQLVLAALRSQAQAIDAYVGACRARFEKIPHDTFASNSEVVLTNTTDRPLKVQISEEQTMTLAPKETSAVLAGSLFGRQNDLAALSSWGWLLVQTQ